jgi:cytochrome P450
VLATTRLAKVDVELSGKTIPAGSLVMLFWPGGNRDEERFPEPERFDPQRTNALQHLSFGKGRHVCLGAMLARMEARISLEVLSQRLRGVRFVDQPQYLPGVVRHFSQLLLAWEVPPQRTKASEAA